MDKAEVGRERLKTSISRNLSRHFAEQDAWQGVRKPFPPNRGRMTLTDGHRKKNKNYFKGKNLDHIKRKNKIPLSTHKNKIGKNLDHIKKKK